MTAVTEQPRLRLAYYSSGLWPCGVATYCRDLVAGFEGIAEVEVFKLPIERVYGECLRSILRAREQYQQIAARSNSFDGVLLDYTATFWNGTRLGENLFPAFARALCAPAVVILHEGTGRTDPADTSGLLPFRAVKRLFQHALAAWDTGTLRYEEFVTKQQFRFAHRLVTHSAQLAQERSADLPAEQIHVLPMPAYPLAQPCWTCEEVDTRFGLKGQRVAVLFGFPQHSKGFDRALRALFQLGPDVRLVQLGYSERAREEALKLAALARELGVAERFLQPGYLEDAEIASLLLRADVSLAPFRSSHMSSSLGHLIAAGAPILASRIPTTETLAAAGAGIHFTDCDTPVTFAHDWQKILTEARLSEELRSKNQRYSHDYGFESIARFLAGLFPRRTANALDLAGAR